MEDQTLCLLPESLSSIVVALALFGGFPNGTRESSGSSTRVSATRVKSGNSCEPLTVSSITAARAFERHVCSTCALTSNPDSGGGSGASREVTSNAVPVPLSRSESHARRRAEAEASRTTGIVEPQRRTLSSQIGHLVELSLVLTTNRPPQLLHTAGRLTDAEA